MSTAFEVVGAREMADTLQVYPRKIVVRVQRKAVRAGAAPMVKALRRQLPKRVRKGVAQKVTASSDRVVSVIGRRKDVQRAAHRGSYTGISEGLGGEAPIHIVEGPTIGRTISPRRRKVLAMRTGGGLRFVHGSVWHPGTSYTPYRARAAQSARTESMRAYSAKVADESDKEHRKLEARALAKLRG